LRRYFSSSTVYGTEQYWYLAVMGHENNESYSVQHRVTVSCDRRVAVGGGGETDCPSTWPELVMKVRNSGIKVGDNDRFMRVHEDSWRFMNIETLWHPHSWTCPKELAVKY
jgi:hypothetical protein